MSTDNIRVMRPTEGVEITVDMDAVKRYRSGQKGGEEKRAWADYLRARRLAAGPARSGPRYSEEGILHGTERCYKRGCDRPECRAAATEARGQRRRQSATKVA